MPLSAFVLVAGLLPALVGPADSLPVELPRTTMVAEQEWSQSRVGGPIDWRSLEAGEASPTMDSARTRKRTQAVEYSGFYHARLTLHRWLSFAMVPLFIGSYATGDQLLKHSSEAPDWALNWHRPLATATAVVFTTNTITGLWNLWDARKDPAGRLKRYVHSLLFIAADAGFTYAGITLAKDARRSAQKRQQHRNVALVSMGVSVTSWGMMLFFK